VGALNRIVGKLQLQLQLVPAVLEVLPVLEVP
jgi:hypothetical protein